MALSVLALNNINGLVTKDTSKILTKIYMVSYLFYYLYKSSFCFQEYYLLLSYFLLIDHFDHVD